MKKEKATIANPTLRWVFQCFDGVNLLQQGDTISLDGFDEFREKIIRLIGGHALHLYKTQKVT